MEETEWKGIIWQLREKIWGPWGKDLSILERRSENYGTGFDERYGRWKYDMKIYFRDSKRYWDD